MDFEEFIGDLGDSVILVKSWFRGLLDPRPVNLSLHNKMIDRLVLATIRSSLPDEKARVSCDLLFRSHFSGDEDLVVRRAFDAIVADDGDTDKSHSQESMDLVYAFLHGKENDAIEPEVLDESMMASFFAIVTSDFRDTSLVRTRLKWDEHRCAARYRRPI